MSDKTAHSSRITAFKNTGKGTQDLRRKRAETSVALRRQAREEQLLKRRACSPDEEDVAPETEVLPTPQEIVSNLKSDDVQVLLHAAKSARRVLSRQHEPPIPEMIRAGVVPLLVCMLDRDDCYDLQFEAAWALTNIASGTSDQTKTVVDSGAVPKLVRLLTYGGAIGEQATWALGNIAGDGAQARDLVLSYAALPALLPMLNKETRPLSLLRTAVWTFSNLCRNKNPLVDLDAVSPALPYISELLTVDDVDTLSDACWSLSYLTDGPDERIECVQQTPYLLERAVTMLSHRAVSVRTPALRAVGNMATGSDKQTDHVLSAGVLSHLVSLLECGKPSLVKEAAWCLSNVVAGTQAQIQRTVEAGLLQPLANVLRDGDAKSQKEAAWAVTNLCLGGNGPQLCALLSSGVLSPYCALLSTSDARTTLVVLEGLSHLLKAADKFGEVEQLCMRLEEEGAIERFEALQQHENEQVYKKTLEILDTYFADEENNAPAQTQDEYQFGAVGSIGEL